MHLARLLTLRVTPAMETQVEEIAGVVEGFNRSRAMKVREHECDSMAGWATLFFMIQIAPNRSAR